MGKKRNKHKIKKNRLYRLSNGVIVKVGQVHSDQYIKCYTEKGFIIHVTKNQLTPISHIKLDVFDARFLNARINLTDRWNGRIIK